MEQSSTAGFDVNQFLNGGGAGFAPTGRHPVDASLRVEFYVEEVRNGVESEKAGYDVFIPVEFVKITTAGIRPVVWAGKVTQEHIKRFPQEYAAFKSKGLIRVPGLPLSEWPPTATKTLVNLFEKIGIQTVEQLSGVAETTLSQIGQAGKGWPEKAKMFLERAAEVAPILQVQQENARLKADQKGLEDQIAKLSKALGKLKKKLGEVPEVDED